MHSSQHGHHRTPTPSICEAQMPGSGSLLVVYIKLRERLLMEKIERLFGKRSRSGGMI
jgi:hypothetical protein